MESVKSDINNALLALDKAGMILFASDGAMVAAVNARNDKAISNLSQISIPFSSPCILVKDEKSLFKFAPDINSNGIEMIRYSEKPTNFVFDDYYGLSNMIHLKFKEVGIRIAKNGDFCKELIKNYKNPILTVELTGIKSPLDLSKELIPVFQFVIHNTSSSLTPSIIKLTHTGEIKILRK